MHTPGWRLDPLERTGPRTRARAMRGWRLRLLCGRVEPRGPMPAILRGRTRLVNLVSAMLLASGVLMALDAPRTLGLYLGLLIGVEGLMLACGGIWLALSWWRRWSHPRGAHRMRHRRSQPPAHPVGHRGTTARPPSSVVGGMPASARWEPRDDERELDWRGFEGALLTLLLIWVWA